MKRFIATLHALVLAAVVVFAMVVTWNETFAHILEVWQEHTETQQTLEELHAQRLEDEAHSRSFDEVVAEGETVKHYLGYRVMETTRMEGHFHHIDMSIGPDRRSVCVECHGDLPHDKSDEQDLRSFWNMHAFLVGCETCHVRLEGEQATGIFRWYDRETGRVIDSPTVGTNPVPYTAKIIPLERVNGEIQRVDSQERIDFARDYEEHEAELTEEQQSRAMKAMHTHLAEEPYVCSDCHGEEPLLPLEELGYSEARVESILGTEVVGLVTNYEEFHMLDILGDDDDSAEVAPDTGSPEPDAPEGSPPDDVPAP